MLKTILENQFRLEKEAISQLVKRLNKVVYKKNDLIVKEFKQCNKLYFIESGLVKLYFDTGEKTFIMTFFYEGQFFNELQGYVTTYPGHYAIQTIEDCVIYEVERDDLELLCKSFISIERFLRILYSFAAVNMMSRISDLLNEDASSRYKKFLKLFPTLNNRIALKAVSEYVGISQVSLSRIRANQNSF